jgi:UDP-glucose 4-epimerase
LQGSRETVAVTGGAGFIGRHLVRALCDEGRHVIIVDCRPTASGSGAEIEYRRADITDPRSISDALRGVGLLFHLAGNANGSISVRKPRLDFQANCVGTFNVLEAAVAAGVEQVVYASSASVYGMPLTFPIDESHATSPIVPYGSSKLAGERIGLTWWHSYGLPFLAARPFCVYGPGEDPSTALVEVGRYLRWQLNGLPIQIVGDGARKTRDFVHVSDLVAGLRLIADRGTPGEVYNIGSGSEVSMLDLVRVIENVTGAAQVREITEITDDTYRLVADISKIRRLGYEPRLDLAEGIAMLAEELGPRPAIPTADTIFKKGQTSELL